VIVIIQTDKQALSQELSYFQVSAGDSSTKVEGMWDKYSFDFNIVMVAICTLQVVN